MFINYYKKSGYKISLLTLYLKLLIFLLTSPLTINSNVQVLNWLAELRDLK